MVRVSLDAFQASWTGAGGSTLTAAATEAGSIGVVNSMATGVVRSRFVATIVRNAARVSGTIGVGGVAEVAAGSPAPTIATPRTAVSPMASPIRETTDRRTSAPR